MKERTHNFDPRQDMSTPDFEIFHYHNVHSADVELHHHDFYMVYYFLGDQTRFQVNGRIYNLQTGDLLLIAPTEFHRPIPVPKAQSVERIVLWISKGFLEQFAGGNTCLTRCFDSSRPDHSCLLRPSTSQRANLAQWLGELLQETDTRDFGSDLYCRGILLQLLTVLNRLSLRAAPRQDEQEPSPLVAKVLDYINEHYSESLSLDCLAQQFFVSKYHLSHEFSTVVGTSVYRCILLKRLHMAKQMLAAGASPGSVYEGCGFSDYANFFRAFKSQYGVSPSDCVEKVQKKPE